MSTDNNQPNNTFVERLKEATKQGLLIQKKREEECHTAILKLLQSTFDNVFMESLKDKALESASYGWDCINGEGTVTVRIPEPRDENNRFYIAANSKYGIYDKNSGSVSEIFNKCMTCDEFDLARAIHQAFESDPIHDNFQVNYNFGHDYQKHELRIDIRLYWGEKKRVFRPRDD